MPRLSWKLLKNNGIDMTPDELREAFAEGQKLIVGERIRPVAAQKLDGNWEVHLVGYSPLSDPLLQGPRNGIVLGAANGQHTVSKSR